LYIQPIKAAIWSLDNSPFGHFFVSGSSDRTARLWAIDRGYPIRIFAHHTSDVDTVKFHPNAGLIATGSTDTTARLWDIRSGDCCRTFWGHTSAVQTVAISPSGRLLATSDLSGTVLIWDIPSGQKVSTLSGHTGRVSGMDFSHGSLVLATGSIDDTVRLWDVRAESSRRDVRTQVQGESLDRVEDDYKNRSMESSLIKSIPLKNARPSYVRFTPENLLLVGATAFSTVDY